MRYLLLIYSDEAKDPQYGTPEFEKLIGDYGKFTKEVREAEVFRGGDALQSVSTATTVRVRNGKAQTTDGPFAETKEQLGGFYELDCKDLDEAIKYAARIPSAKHGSIEIRPIQEYN